MKNTKRGKRPPLTTEKIAIAAIEISDKEGLESLSMRKIGEKLEVEAMSLYHHLSSKEKLMEAMVLEMVVHLPLVAENQNWRACLTRVAGDWRGLAKRHPGAFPLLATRGQTPQPLLERYSSIIRVMVSHGFTYERGAMAINSFFFGMNGYLLAAGEPSVFREVPEATQLPDVAEGPLSELTKIPAAAWDFASDHLFDQHVEFLLAGVEQLLKQKFK